MPDRYCVKLMSRALRDLDEIYAENLSEPKTAENMLDSLEKGIYSLETLPYRCSERKIGAYANKGYRQLFVKRYTIVFRIDEDTKTVIIVTVRYSPSQF